MSGAGVMLPENETDFGTTCYTQPADTPIPHSTALAAYEEARSEMQLDDNRLALVPVDFKLREFIGSHISSGPFEDHVSTIFSGNEPNTFMFLVPDLVDSQLSESVDLTATSGQVSSQLKAPFNGNAFILPNSASVKRLRCETTHIEEALAELCRCLKAFGFRIRSCNCEILHDSDEGGYRCSERGSKHRNNCHPYRLAHATTVAVEGDRRG